MVPCAKITPECGFSTKYATPALVDPFTVTAVSSAPQSLPFAYTTCCMRESLLGSLDSTFANGPVPPVSSRQQPFSVGVTCSKASARQSRRGTSPAFWSDEGGTAYVFTC